MEAEKTSKYQIRLGRRRHLDNGKEFPLPLQFLIDYIPPRRGPSRFNKYPHVLLPCEDKALINLFCNTYVEKRPKKQWVQLMKKYDHYAMNYYDPEMRVANNG